MTLQEILARKAEIAKRKTEISEVAKRAAKGEQVSEDLSALTAEVEQLDTEARGLMAQELEIRSTTQFSSVVSKPEEKRHDETPLERAQRSLESEDYKRSLMRYMQRGTPIPVQYREDLTTVATDAAAVIPTSWLNEIIKEAKVYGTIYPRCRQLNIKGGVKVPILSLKPTATWITETSPSDTQKIQSTTAVEFSYNALECKVAQSLLVNVSTLDAFQALFTSLAAEAMAKAMDLAVVAGNGDGKPKGITADNRVPEGNVITLTAAEFKSWSTGWKKKVFAKIKKSYQRGEFFMAQGTFDGYIDGMVDEVGQPIGRTNYGIADGSQYRFGGKTVETVEDEIIENYDAAGSGDVVAIFANLNDYAINSNMQMTVVRWTDHDTNEIKNKAILIADGKLLDPNGVLIIKKA